MPTISLDLLSLFVATDEQVRLSRERHRAEWGTTMSQSQYHAYYGMLDASSCASDGKLITWVLAPRDHPTTLDFLASCETFRREGIYWDTSGPRSVTCYGVASVYTPPEHRHRGYARHMTCLLHWVLADASVLPAQFPRVWGDPPSSVPEAGRALFSALWSDVGNFYQSCGLEPHSVGWLADRPFSTVWFIGSDFHEGQTELEMAGWKWLDEAEVQKAWGADAKHLVSQHVPPGSFAFLPDNGVAAFQQQSVPFFASMIQPPIALWRVVKLMGNSTDYLNAFSSEGGTFATWTVEVRPPNPRTLLITRLCSRKQDFEALLRILQHFSKQHGLERIEVYNLPPELGDSFGGCTVHSNVMNIYPHSCGTDQQHLAHHGFIMRDSAGVRLLHRGQCIAVSYIDSRHRQWLRSNSAET